MIGVFVISPHSLGPHNKIHIIIITSIKLISINDLFFYEINLNLLNVD